MAEMLLEAADLHTYYGLSHILRGANFAVSRGETVGLMGRNSMGKTTLLRSMLGHVKPRSGTVRVRGKPMTGAPPYLVARQVGVIAKQRIHRRSRFDSFGQVTEQLCLLNILCCERGEVVDDLLHG